MMKRILQTLALLLAALMVSTTAVAAYVQLADGVYQDGTALYICSNVTSLGNLQVNPSEIYCYAQTPRSCLSGTFTGYGATLHVPTSAMVSYFTAQYWYNFNNVLADAVEPQLVTINTTSAELESGQQLSLSATVTPSNATPKTVYWSSTNTSVATVSNGVVIAVGEGECYIRAICVDKQAICHVTVTPQRTTITLDKQEARLLPNHTMTLTATCTPATTDLVVTSSNPAVAIPRYVNGTIMVVGVSEGTATITVSTADGWCYPAECQVTVYTEVGDLNSDGFVNMDDLTVMINYLLTNDATGINLTNADTNLKDGVSMDDLTALINFLLTNVWPWDEPVIETYTVNGVSFNMVTVKGGTFTMGATAEQDDDANSNEKPTHQVTLSSYSIGETEVTQALWLAVMGSNPSHFTGNLQRPVECVSWNACQEFISKLNQMTGKNFRLPTEAEWEYAARGGNKSQGYKYAGGNTVGDVAWYYDNSYALGGSSPDYGTHTVASKTPNELGLYDMSGNVWEFCQDWSGSYSSDAQTNPTGATSGSYSVLRGGSWCDNARYCRVSCRIICPTAGTNSGYGLRLAFDPDNSSKFRLSETVVEIEVGETAMISILHGSGNYSIAGGTDYVNSTTINGETLTITGTAVGTTTVHVTDNTTGAATVLTVIVKPARVETFTVNGVSFKMVTVEGGTFMMGASDDDPEAFSWDKPAHQVTLSSYSIGETEVTQALWLAVMGSNPSYFTPTNGYAENLQRPMERVSWNDCQQFVSKLNQMTGKNFRLPTEAEWEYAASGGKKSHGYKYAGSNTIGYVAWYLDNSYALGSSSPDYGTHTVATKAPNELGLYDMSGNVWEWCQDRYGSYSSEAQTNPTGPSSGSQRIFRGGSWDDSASGCRVSTRGYYGPSNTYNYLGLRLAL